MSKLPLWATVREAARAFWANRALLARFALVPLVLEVAADLWRQNLTMGPGAEMAILNVSRPLSWHNAVLLFAEFLPSLVVIPFIAQSYRLFLLGPAAVAGDGLLRVGRECWGLAAVAVLIFAVLNLPVNFMIGFIGFGGALPVLLVILYALAFVVLAVRLIFIYPVICLGRPWALPARWRETRGNFWRLLGALAAVSLPVWALVLTVSLLTPPALHETGLWQLWPVAALLPQMAAGLAMEALIAAVTVIAFATLTGHPAMGVHPATPRSANP